jgi:ATP-dependent DNA helicase PIF1
LIGADLIIWDEAPMAPLQALNTIDRLLRKLMNNDFPFGGKTIVLGGDFRQVTPVVTHANKTKIIENSIKSGKLWKEFKVMKLYINMRAGEGEKEFAEWLLKLGNGELKVEFNEDIIEIPSECVVKGDLVDELNNSDIDLEDIKNICIFAPKNEHVDF